MEIETRDKIRALLESRLNLQIQDKSVLIFTDGSSKGEKAGAGVIIYDQNKKPPIVEFSFELKNKTSNEAELIAIREALKILLLRRTVITKYSYIQIL